MEKINEIKARLKTAKKDGMPVDMRMKLRNQASAQMSRIKKKQEVQFLKHVYDEQQDKIRGILEIIESHMADKPDLLREFKQEIASLE